jgi:hypothetical protein
MAESLPSPPKSENILFQTEELKWLHLKSLLHDQVSGIMHHVYHKESVK